jgi:DNA-binding transcriptional regulator LsrR (DeoR family)
MAPSIGRNRSLRPPESDQLRLMGKVARMYHERGLNQPQIAAALSLSQPRVSRLLRQAAELGIVKTVVTMPPGTHTDVEDALQDRFRMRDVVVVDASGGGGDVLPALAAATASYLDVTLTGGHVIGVSSWSETLMGAVDLMQPKNAQVADLIVQILGGLGNSAVQMQATRLTDRLADLTGATPVLLPAPGLVGSPAIRKTLLRDATIAETAALWKRLDVALVGIGSLQPSPLVQRSGNAIGEPELEELRGLGAVGDVCFRYFDADGHHVHTQFDDRLIGITADELRNVSRRIGVAGGDRKFTAIRAALRGGWINVLITDLAMAKRLIRQE